MRKMVCEYKKEKGQWKIWKESMGDKKMKAQNKMRKW